jgi:ferredoxin
MPNVTFSSPMHKDKTVYAVAGSHKQTVLSLAKENHIPIDFGCQNGECGTCLVKAHPVGKDKHHKMGNPLTDCEVNVLREMGKLTKEQVDRMRVDDLCPTEWRLACQMVVRDEDLLVEYPSK